MSQTQEQTNRLVSITRRWLAELDKFKSHYDEIEKGYLYLAGEQFDKAQLKWFEQVRRPARVFNLIFPLFNSILGDFLLNDEKIRVYPLPGGDAQVAASFEDLLDHSNMQNDSRSQMAQYALAGCVKMGFMFPRFSNEVELDGSLVFREVDEFEVLFDSAATDYLLDDAEYMARSRWLSKRQILNRYSHIKKELEPLLIDREDENFYDREGVDQNNTVLYDNFNICNLREGKYRLIEWHEKKYEDVEVFVKRDGTSAIWTLEGRKADLFRKLNPDGKIVKREDEIKTITTIIPGLNYFITEKRADIQDRTFDIVPFSAYNYGRRTYKNYGIFKNSLGPQDDFNSWQNQQNAVMNKAINPGNTYKPSAMENPKAVELEGNAPGVNYQVKGEFDIDKVIKQNETVQLPFAPAQLAAERGEVLKKIIGITPNMMGGQDTKQENASLFAQRVRRGQVALQILFNNFSRSKRRLYNKQIRIMQENYTTTKFFLITTVDKENIRQRNLTEEYGANILNDIRKGRYEIVADDMERNPTAKNLRFMQKSDVVQTVLTMFGNVGIPPQAISYILQSILSESDLGDVNQFIQSFSQVAQQGQAEQGDQMQ
ncbi:MAG: hypothetical protein H8D67_26660, partial [Deltaproteobacteria bacterium]|nr:hypothetical protein [Deltaproteobacteria bacterium]